MTPLRMVCALAFLVMGSLVLSVALSEARADGKLDCGSTHVTVGHFRLGGPVRARDVSCRRARAVIHFALTHTRGNAPLGPSGWVCVRGGSPEVSRYAVTCRQRRGNGRAWLLNGEASAASLGA